MLRTFVYYGSADATVVGFLAPRKDTASPRDGAWVRVTGRLEKRDAGGAQRLETDARLPDACFTAVHGGYRFAAERVEFVEPPEVEFAFFQCEGEPYGF